MIDKLFEWTDDENKAERELAMPAWERPCMIRDFLQERAMI